MSKENTINAPTWSEGGPSVDSMSADDAKAEISAIEKSPAFADSKDNTEFWQRQRMLRRRSELYSHVTGEAGKEPYSFMNEELKRQGIDEEFLENEQERFEDRDETESRKKTMDTLITHFGGKDEAKKAIVQARGLLNRFAGPEDLVFLEDSGLGNDPELIGKLAEIAEIFKRGGKK